MVQLSSEGQNIVSDLAGRHGFSQDAVTHMLVAVNNGGGTQAQFDHWEFGGMGQWSMGGMIMIGDMFNNMLKGRVDALCNDLSNSLRNATVFQPMGSSQSQSQGGYQTTAFGNSSLFVQEPGQSWPQELGQPSSQGAQNDMRYAFFPSTRRLAVKIGGRTTIYDAGDHQIGGFGQQQSGSSTDGLTFSSQFGTYRPSDLPVISVDGVAPQQSQPAPQPTYDPQPEPMPEMAQQPNPTPEPVQAMQQASAEGNIIDQIERLGALRDRGILTDEEFTSKKSELLSRL
ncbi:SHOCT domain-containing protein [Chachezhania antarctica]|uniref:SHOCT domain-containing protein n=1 Tax=Chachezhania antarctica TaxID=2340860 RepID=UPI000EB5AA8B|nr:SHOCT domain-containing protein [Chachezhania antarctica]|tara:strand:- start:15002 stop:15856 length:855 start_codon:yes stop_codon:yes gene_type:complete